jgi:hypothetical protein
MNSTTIKIDGAKLRQLLESKTGKTIYQIALESGYSNNVISNAVRNGYASSAVQNIARLYGITPDEYKIKDPEPVKEPAQLSIDDIEAIKYNELKAIIKEALREELLLAIDGDVIIKRGEDLKAAIRQVIFDEHYIRVSGIDYDPKNQRFKLIVNKEDLK